MLAIMGFSSDESFIRVYNEQCEREVYIVDYKNKKYN